MFIIEAAGQLIIKERLDSLSIPVPFRRMGSTLWVKMAFSPAARHLRFSRKSFYSGIDTELSVLIKS